MGERPGVDGVRQPRGRAVGVDPDAAERAAEAALHARADGGLERPAARGRPERVQEAAGAAGLDDERALSAMS